MLNSHDQLYTLSDVQIVGDARINPAHHEVDIAVKEFCAKHNILSPNYAGYSTMSFYLYPHADVEYLTAIDILMNTLYYIDDEVNNETMLEEDIEGRNTFRRALHILQTGQGVDESNSFYNVWFELHQRFRSLTSQRTLDRIVNALKYLLASTYSLASFSDNGHITPDHFIKLRLHLSGMQVCTEIAAFVHDLELEEITQKHPLINQMIDDTAFYGAMLNDVFSYHKEITAGSKLNLIAVLMEHHNWSVHQAVHHVVEMLNERVTRFKETKTKVNIQHSGDSVDTYVQALEDILSASWHWQYSTNRYRSPDSPIPELRQRVHEDHTSLKRS